MPRRPLPRLSPRLSPSLAQLAWFVLLWAAGVATVTLVAQGIRWWLSGT
jgi:hypothetical protein